MPEGLDERGGQPAETYLEWPYPFDRHLHELVPNLQEAQSAWLSQIDSLRSPDRKTHELIRMVCTVILRNPEGIERHAMLAAEVGASWEEILGSILLTEPAFGLLPAVAALPAARRGFNKGQEPAAQGGETRAGQAAALGSEAASPGSDEGTVGAGLTAPEAPMRVDPTE